MAADDSKQTEKSFTVQTVRVPKHLEKFIKHRMVDADESFQGYALRLILEDIVKGVPGSHAGSPILATIPINEDRPAPTISPTVMNVLEQLVSFGTVSAKLLEDARRQGEPSGGHNYIDPKEAERRAKELERKHIRDKDDSRKAGAPKRLPREKQG